MKLRVTIEMELSEEKIREHFTDLAAVEYLHVLKLAAEETVGKVEPVLQGCLGRPGKWRAIQVREQLAPVVRKVIELAALTPSLKAYDTLLEGGLAQVG